MAQANITNGMLNQLLGDLGFERLRTTEKMNQLWRHPQAGTTIVLPANKLGERALRLDLHSLRTTLHYNGHLDQVDFDAFVTEGELPQASR